MLARLNAYLVVAAMLCARIRAVTDVVDEQMTVEEITSELKSNGTLGEVPAGRTLLLLHLLKQKLYNKFQRVPTTLPTFRGCFCVPYYLCDINNTIINDGSGVIDLRYRQCTGDLEVCCFLRATSIIMPTMPIVTVPTAPVTAPTTVITVPPAPVTVPTTVVTVPTTVVTVPTTVVTVPTTPVTVPTTPVTVPTTPVTVPTTPVTVPTTPVTIPTTPVTIPTTPVTIPTAPVTIPTAPVTIPTAPVSVPTAPVTIPTAPVTIPSPVVTISPFQPFPPVTISPFQPLPPVTISPFQPFPSFPFPPMRQSITLPTTPAPNVVVPQNLYCTCVPLYQCALYSSGQLVPGSVDGNGIINPRQQPTSTCIGAYVCCSAAAGQGTGLVPVQPNPSFPAFTLPTTAAPPVPLPPIVIGQSCVCMLIIACSTGYFPISGVGQLDPRLILARQGQPAASCSSSNSMCCPLAHGNGPRPQTNFAPPQANPAMSSSIVAGDVKNPGTADACSCVVASQCADGNAVTYDGVGAIDPRFGPCASATLVCCRLSRRQLVGSATGQNSVYVGPPSANPAAEAVCGLRDTTYAGSAQVAGTTYFAEFPWMTLLLVRKAGSNDVFQCGGSLINSRTVLTAAHCVVSCEPGTLVARVGEWNTQSGEEPLPAQEVYAERIVIHPQYSSGGLYHDVALVVLSNSVGYAVNVRPVCLPAQGQAFVAGTICYASGWGRSSFGEGGSYQTVLRKVDLPIIDNTDCQTRLRATRLGPIFQLHSSFICAGGQASKDTCYKDGGGPLVCQDPSGRFTQAGIISWGIGCGTNTPAVYASVAQHRQWIDQTLQLSGINY